MVQYHDPYEFGDLLQDLARLGLQHFQTLADHFATCRKTWVRLATPQEVMRYLEKRTAAMSAALREGPDLLSSVDADVREAKLSDLKKRTEDLAAAVQELITHYIPDDAGGRFT